ncbi:MAG TPA: glycosyltransferase, partial [Labilithrix sp.]|nr:glycosyltransferase [Labilithrix sp.]
MRIVFFSYGTRGDAQPQVVLASALRERGYQVRVAAPENLRRLVEGAGVEYAPLSGNSQEILESEAGRRWLSSGNVRAFMKEMGKINARINPDIFKSAVAAASDADAIVGGTLTEDLSFTLA